MEETPVGPSSPVAPVEPTSLAATLGRVAVGARVTAQFRNGEWYPATITVVHPDGTYAVLFDDGVSEVLPLVASSEVSLNPHADRRSSLPSASRTQPSLPPRSR